MLFIKKKPDINKYQEKFVGEKLNWSKNLYAICNICLLYVAIKFICWNNKSDLSTNGSGCAATVVVTWFL
jgi:hypothetical protein